MQTAKLELPADGVKLDRVGCTLGVKRGAANYSHDVASFHQLLLAQPPLSYRYELVHILQPRRDSCHAENNFKNF